MGHEELKKTDLCVFFLLFVLDFGWFHSVVIRVSSGLPKANILRRTCGSALFSSLNLCSVLGVRRLGLLASSELLLGGVRLSGPHQGCQRWFLYVQTVEHLNN